MERELTIFHNFVDIESNKNLNDIIEIIKSKQFKNEIQQMRNFYSTNNEKYNKLKQKLPAFTASGKFSERKNNALIEYSRYIILDVDKLSESSVIEYKRNAMYSNYSKAIFISPSGIGLKIIVEVDSNPEYHKIAFRQIKKYYEQVLSTEIDESGSDIARLCFFSYDPDAFFNHENKIFKVDKNELSKQFENNSNTINSTNSNEDVLFDLIQFTSNVVTYTEGSRNNFIHLFASNANRRGVPQDETKYFCQTQFDLPENEIRATVKSAYSNTSEFGKFKSKYDCSKQTHNRLVPSKKVTLHSLITRSENEPSPQYIWRGIKEGSFGFIFGLSKSGKTIICENLALALAANKTEFMGSSLINGSNKVLFISLEEFWQSRSQRNQKQLEELSYQFNPENFLVVDETFPRNIASQEEFKFLEKYIAESKANIVFIDSLSRLYSGSIESSDLAKDLLFKLREISNNLKITLIIIHHSPKGDGKPLTINSAAGSRIIAQECDFMIGVGKTSDGTRYIKDVAYRYAKEDEECQIFEITDNCTIITLDKCFEGSILKEEDGRIDNSNKDLIKDFFIEYCTKPGEFIQSKNLLEHFVDSGTMSKPTLFSNLKKLQKDGFITKTSKGSYQRTFTELT